MGLQTKPYSWKSKTYTLLAYDVFDYFDNFFTKVSNVHRHHTRSQCNFHVQASHTIYINKSVKYRGTLFWNQLRDNVKNLPNFNLFKKQLVSFLRGSWMSVVCCNCAYMHTKMHLCVFLSSFCNLTILSFYSSSNHLCCVSIEQLDLNHVNGDI